MIELLSDSRTVVIALLSAITVLVSALLAVFAWIGRRKLQRLDYIEKEVERDLVRKPELQQMASTMRAERERLHAENSARLERIEDMVTRTHASLIDLGVMNQRILNAEQRIQELRDFKHSACEPAVRYIDFLQKEKPWERK